MSLKSKLEAIIYAAEEPVSVEQMAALLKDELAAEAGGEAGDNPLAQARTQVRRALDELLADYQSPERGLEIRKLAGGYRMSTKPEHHDAVRAFAKSLKPPVRLSLPALETLSVIAYKQPITLPEINEIRGVDAGAVIGTLLDRKLITTAGRKQVIGRPILYKTTKDFLLRFGLNDLGDLPSMQEFEKLAGGVEQADLFAGGEGGAAATPEEKPEEALSDPENASAG